MFHATVPVPPVVGGFASLPDLLRLVAVPVLAWAAWRDYQTRRVPDFHLLSTPLVILGFLLLLWEGIVALRGSPIAAQLFLFRAGFSLGIFVPMAYFLRWRDLFGGVDARAFIILAVLFPTYPIYNFAALSFPIVVPPMWIFSLTVLTNAALFGLIFPVLLASKNLLHRDISPKMFIGKRVTWNKIPETHGRILDSPEGMDLHGLDLDALRMYLRWRKASLTDVRERPAELRDPSTIPDERGEPTDGRLDSDEWLDEDTTVDLRKSDADPFKYGDDWEYVDTWAAEEFLKSVGGAYGATSNQLRYGLENLSTSEKVWVTPGLPFIVLVFGGLLVGLVYGDIFYTVMQIAGLG